MDNNAVKCACPHHSVVPVFIALLGLVLLGHAVGLITDGFNAVVWPAIILVIGLVKMFSRGCKCCSR